MLIQTSGCTSCPTVIYLKNHKGRTNINLLNLAFHNDIRLGVENVLISARNHDILITFFLLYYP